MEGLVVQVDQNVLLFVGNEGYQFFDPLWKVPFFALVVARKM